jgi:MFS family permease
MTRINEKTTARVAPFAMDLVFTVYYLAAPLLLVDLKANPIQLGLVGTLASSIHMGMAHLMGHISDRLGRRPLVIIAPLTFVASCLLMTQVKEIWIILALSVLNGLGLSIYWPCLQAWIADHPTGTGQIGLARDIGTFNLSWTAATLVGPILSGFLYTLYPRLPFLVGAAFAVMLFVLVFTSVHENTPIPAEKALPLDTATSSGRRGFLYAAWAANFSSWFIMGNTRYQFPKLARELDIPHHMIGMLLGVVGLALFAGFFFLRRTDHWLFSKRYLFGAQLTGHGRAFHPCCDKGADSLCSRVRHDRPFLQRHLLLEPLLRRPSSQGKRKGNGATRIHIGGGAVLGPILGGVAAQYAGLRAPYMLCFAILAAAIGMQLILTRREKTS